MFIFRPFHIVWMISILMIAACAHQTAQRIPEKIKPVHDHRAIALFIDGLNHEMNENFPAALLTYQEALLYDSTSSTIYFNIAKNYLRLGKDESAILALKHSLEIDSDHMEAWDLLASIYAKQGWWDLVEKTYVSMAERDSANENTLSKLALVYLRSNQKEKAIDIYQRMLKLQPAPDAKVLLALGELYFDLARYDKSGAMFQQLIALQPESGFGYFGSGMTREALGDTTGAIEFYEEAIFRTPELDEARKRLGQIYIARQAWAKAIRLNTDAVQIDSTDLERWLELGDLYQQTGDSIEAISLYQEVQSRFPEEWQAHFNYGRFLMRQQAYVPALNAFKTVQALSPDNGFGWLFSGIAYAHLDSLEAAERDLLKALSFESEDPMGNYYLGTIYMQLQQYSKAIPHLRRALAVRNQWISALSALANAYESLKYYDQADSVFQYSLSLEPDNALLLNNYAYSLSLRGQRLDEALAMGLHALEQEPDNGAYLDTVGWIYFLLNNPQKALEYIKKAVVIHENSYEVYDHLGDVYAAMNQIDQARDAWKRALQLDAENSEIQRKLGELRE